MARKQVPSISVSTRVPIELYARFNRYIEHQKKTNFRVSKNGVFVEALELFLNTVEELEEGWDMDDDQDGY